MTWSCFSFDEFNLTQPKGADCYWGQPLPDTSCNDPIHISAGGKHTCLVRQNDTAWCWGDNAFSQLGIDGDVIQAEAHVPQRVARLSKVSQISSGARHTCAINDQEVWCWGDNYTGQAIGPTAQPSHVLRPVKVDGLDQKSWAMVAAGGDHSCAVTTAPNREVWC
jgi:alpha-tubulin suppressor-like RCC1 family protein